MTSPAGSCAIALAMLDEDLAAERRALDRLDPRAQLVADRERVGLLLDRAVRVAESAIVRRRAALDAAATAAPRPLLVRLGVARSTLDAAGATLAVLDP